MGGQGRPSKRCIPLSEQQLAADRQGRADFGGYHLIVSLCTFLNIQPAAAETERYKFTIVKTSIKIN